MFEVRRPFRNRWFAQGSYIYGVSKAIMDGTSSQAASNWGNMLVPDDPSHPPLARRRTTRPPRQLLGLVRDPGRLGHHHHGVGLLLRPVGTSVHADVLRRHQRRRPHRMQLNDLQYTPASASEVTFTGGTYQDLLNFMQADDCLAKYMGKVIPRNACRAPWQNQLDMRFNFGLPFKRIKAEITLDVLNFINLLDSDKGLQRYATFNTIQPVTPTSARQRPGHGLQHRVPDRADVPEVQPRRPPLALAAPARRTHPVLGTRQRHKKAAAGKPAAAFFLVNLNEE